jgi:hypothetical protein
MVFVPYTSGLEYYNSDPRPGFECYADIVFEPHDILLQVHLPAIASGYTMQVKTYKPDGITLLADDTGSFEWYYGKGVYGNIVPGTVYYANIRCNQFSTAMHDNGCFVLEVIIKNTGGGVVFDQFTQKYELDRYGNGSCSYPTDVTITEGTIKGNTAYRCGAQVRVATCYEHLMKLTTIFDCYDNYLGDFYGDPNMVYGGNASTHFPFVKMCYVPMRMYEPPFELKRTISLNCRTQKTEITPKFSLRGEKAFPAWKKREIEYMWLANHIYVDGQEWQSEGGTIFSAPWKPYPYGCVYHYKLEAPIQSCYQYQMFGCSTGCTSQTAYYRIAKAAGKYYDDAGSLIATDADGLMQYFNSQNGVVSVQDVTVLASGLPCSSYLVLNVVSDGPLPAFLYTDHVTVRSRTYATYLPANSSDLTALCKGTGYVTPCATPVVGVGEVHEYVCAVPVLGAGIVADATDAVLAVAGAGSWLADPAISRAAIADGITGLNISVSSTSYNNANATFADEKIGHISGSIPLTDVLMMSTQFPQLPESAMLRLSGSSNIDGGGYLYYTGDATSADAYTAHIEIFGLTYELNTTGEVAVVTPGNA